MNRNQDTTDRRPVYEEYVTGGLSVAVLSDPGNMQAWIQSDTTVDIRW